MITTAALRMLLLLCLAGLSLPRQAAAAQLTYTFYILGLPALEAAITMDLTPGAYRLSARYRTVGLGRVALSGHQFVQVRGAFLGGQPVPAEYDSTGNWRGWDRTARLTYRDGMPTVTALTPANETERQIVPEALRARTIDPLSVIAALIHTTAQTGRCDGTARTFDGRRLVLFEVRSAGEEDIPATGRSVFSGRALPCDFTERELAGFRIGPDSESETAPRHGTIWLARVQPGGEKVPVRAAIANPWPGNATMYLTEVSP